MINRKIFSKTANTSISSCSTVVQQPRASCSHTHLPLFIKALYFDTGQGRWRSATGKVTVGLAEGNGEVEDVRRIATNCFRAPVEVLLLTYFSEKELSGRYNTIIKLL